MFHWPCFRQAPFNVWRWRLSTAEVVSRRQPPDVQRLQGCVTPDSAAAVNSRMLSCHAVSRCLLSELMCNFRNFLNSLVNPHVAPQPNRPCPRDILGLFDDFPCLGWLWSAELQMATGGKLVRWQDWTGCMWHSSDIQLEFRRMQFSNPTHWVFVFLFVASFMFVFHVPSRVKLCHFQVVSVLTETWRRGLVTSRLRQSQRDDRQT